MYPTNTVRDPRLTDTLGRVVVYAVVGLVLGLGSAALASVGQPVVEDHDPMLCHVEEHGHGDAVAGLDTDCPPEELEASSLER